MATKLTLSIEETVIKKAKEFAKKNHTSLSQIIEDYFIKITQKDTRQGDEKPAISPLVKKLSGVIQLPDNFDNKKERAKYLEEKYK